MSFAAKNPALAIGLAGAGFLLIPMLVRRDVGRSIDAAFDELKKPQISTNQTSAVGALLLMGKRAQARARR